MMRALVSPKGLATFPHIHHPQLAIIGPVTGHVLIDHTQCLGLLAERTGSDCSVGTRVCKGDTGSICQREQVFTHAFDPIYVTSLQTFRNDFFGREIVSDQPVVTTRDQLGPFLEEIDPHDLPSLAEDCLLLEEQRDDIISDQILTDLEELYLEISPQSDHSEASGGSPISQQVEDVPLVKFLGHLEGMLWSEGTQCGIPEADTTLEIPHKEVLVDDGESVCPFGKDCAHHLKFLIETIDLYLALGGFPSLALLEVTAADELFLIEDGYSFDLHRLVLSGKMEV